MLTTIGRRSGKRRAVTLYAWPDAERLVVVGSWAGRDRDPAWALNLRAEPRATVGQGARQRDVRAVEVAGAERERLWALVVEAFPMYAAYQRRTTRRIPLFVLEPVETTG
jgi:deazaflavin-dependent oxidoreductase (nitroreductase family)